MPAFGFGFGTTDSDELFPHLHQEFEKRVGVNRVAGSLRAYKYVYMHVEKFLNEKYKLTDLPFTALDRSFIEKYDLHLRTDYHLALSSIVNLTTSFRTIVNKAVADGILTFNPFWGYEPERPQWKQKYLTAFKILSVKQCWLALRCESWC